MFTTQVDLSSDARQLTQDELLLFMFLSKYRPTTRKTYQTILKKFYQWCLQNNLNMVDVKRAHAQLYVEFLKQQNLKNNSVIQYVTVCKTYYSHLEADDVVVKNPFNRLSLPKVHEHEINRPHLNRTQFCNLLEYAKSQGDKETLIVMLLGIMGLRASELCALTLSSVSEFENGYRMVRFIGKGDKPANLPMPILVARHMDSYLEEFPYHKGPLFLNKLDRPYTRTTISAYVHSLCLKANVPPVRCHALRRSMVTNSLNAGADMREVQKAARHSDLRTTSRIYDQGTVAHDSSSMNILAGYISGAL